MSTHVDRTNRAPRPLGLAAALAVVLTTSPAGLAQVDDHPASEVSESAAAEPAAPQDEVQALKTLEGDLITLHGRVVELWKVEDNRRPIQKLVLDPESSPTLITAVGRLLANNKVREAIPDFIELLASGRLAEKERDDLFTYVIMPFQDGESVFGELDAAVIGTDVGPEQRARVFDVYVDVVERIRDKRRDATARYAAVDRLLKVADQIGDTGRAAVLATLSRLCGGVVSYDDVGEWRTWFERLTGQRADRSLSMQDIYRDLWDLSRAEAKRLREQRRELARDIITRMRRVSEPPVGFLVDPDAEVRKTALIAIQAMSKDLPPETRAPAVAALIASLREAHPADDVGDLVAAAGALGRDAGDDDRRALVGALLEGGVPADPGRVLALVRAIGAIGLVDHEGRLEEIYDAARAEGAEWERVRLDTIKVAQADPRSIDLVLEGLSDVVPGVREAAAVVLIGLRDRLGDRATECVGALARKAATEESAGARRRMLESVRALAGENAAVLDPEGLRGVIEASAREGVGGRRVALGIVAAALRRGDLDDDLLGELEKPLASSLNGQSSTELRQATVAAIVETPSARALAVLEAWLVKPKSRNGAWKSGKEALLDARKDDAAACWNIARRLAAWENDVPWFAAVEFGSRAVAVIAVAADHPLKPRLPELQDAVARWRGRTDDPAAWSRAIEYMNGRVTATPNQAQLRLDRAELLARLAERDEEKRDELRRQAVADLEFALSDAAVGLLGDQRPDVLRRLAGHRLELGRAVAALDAMARIGGELGDADLWLRARARVLDRDVDRSPALSDLSGLGAPFAEQLGDAFHLASAAAILLDPDSPGHEEAAAHLGRLTASDTPLAVALAAMLERSRATRAAFARLVDGQATDEDRGTLAEEIDLCLLHAIAALLQDAPAERGRAVVGALRSVVGKEVLGGVSWPDDANGQAASTVANELRKLWRARPVPQKIAGLFLKGT